MIKTNDAILSIIDKFSKKIKPTQQLVNNVNKLDDIYTKAVRNWIASDKIDTYKPEQLDFMEIKEKLIEHDYSKIVEMFEGWEEQPEFALSLSDKFALLVGMMPINQSTTLFGVEDLPPSTFEQKKFIAQYKVFDSPMLVIDLLNAGILTGLEVDALGILYPTILSTIQGAIIEAIVDLKSKGISSLGMKKMNLINTILQIPRLSPEKLQQLQAAYSEEEKEKTNVKAENVSTEIQRISLGE